MGVKQQLEGFPYRQILIMSLIRFSEPIAFTSLFPYLYFMIRDFKVAPVEKDIAKYSGYLASCFAFFQFLFAVKWGKLSDIYGRKSILLIGLFGSAISSIMFGFAPTYWFAFFARSVNGILNGNIAVLRTVVGEIATEKRHQALAFLSLPLLWNLGCIIGPAIGGSSYLTRPKEDSPYADVGSSVFATSGLAFARKITGSIGEVISSTKVGRAVSEGVNPTLYESYEAFITKYPYALSNIVVAIILVFSMACGFLFLEETHPVMKYKKDYGLELGDWLLLCIGISSPRRAWEDHAQLTSIPNESTRLLEASGEEVTNEEMASKSKTKDYSGAFTDQVIKVAVSNFVVSLHSITHSEFLPVFLAQSFKKDKLEFPWRIAGGFGWGLGSIGTLISSTGIVGMLIILFIFPYVDSKYGTVKGYKISVTVFPLVYFLTPLIIFTMHEYNPRFPTWFATFALYSLAALKSLGALTGLSQIMLLTHRTAALEHRAYINSSSMSLIALARFIGPIVFGYLMSVGEEYEIGWLIWWVLGVLAVFGMIPSFFIIDDTE